MPYCRWASSTAVSTLSGDAPSGVAPHALTWSTNVFPSTSSMIQSRLPASTNGTSPCGSWSGR